MKRNIRQLLKGYACSPNTNPLNSSKFHPDYGSLTSKNWKKKSQSNSKSANHRAKIRLWLGYLNRANYNNIIKHSIFEILSMFKKKMQNWRHLTRFWFWLTLLRREIAVITINACRNCFNILNQPCPPD